MRKLLAIFVLLLVVAVVTLALSNRTGLSLGGVQVTNSADGGFIEQRTLDFLEDIRFKDFDKAASYHSVLDRKEVKVADLIERIFAIKPEFLDILRYEVLAVELDRSGTRGRVKTRTVVKILNTGEVKEPEVIFYWHKDPRDGWVMRLESSLHGAVPGARGTSPRPAPPAPVPPRYPTALTVCAAFPDASWCAASP